MTSGSMSFCFPLDHCARPRSRGPGLDFGSLQAQLQTHKHLTLQLLWEEYRETHADGYGYSRFCELYQRWNRNRDVVLRQDHKAGEKTFVDWAGDTVPIHDRATGEAAPASIFVAVLGASHIHVCARGRSARICRTGLTAMCAPSSFSRASQGCWCRIIRAPELRERAAMSRISTAPITRWRSITVSPSCPRGRNKPRDKSLMFHTAPYPACAKVKVGCLARRPP